MLRETQHWRMAIAVQRNDCSPTPHFDSKCGSAGGWFAASASLSTLLKSRNSASGPRSRRAAQLDGHGSAAHHGARSLPTSWPAPMQLRSRPGSDADTSTWTPRLQQISKLWDDGWVLRQAISNGSAGSGASSGCRSPDMYWRYGGGVPARITLMGHWTGIPACLSLSRWQHPRDWLPSACGCRRGAGHPRLGVPGS